MTNTVALLVSFVALAVVSALPPYITLGKYSSADDSVAPSVTLYESGVGNP